MELMKRAPEETGKAESVEGSVPEGIDGQEVEEIRLCPKRRICGTG